MTIAIILLVAVVILIQLQVFYLRKELRITDRLLVEVVEQTLIKKLEKILKGPILKTKTTGKKRGRPAKNITLADKK